MGILEVDHLRYYYRTRRGPVRAVDDVSFSLEPGKTLAIVGESGCGKTSTATAILRLLPRNVETYEGQVRLDGTDIMTLDNDEFRKQVRWRGISMVFQGAMNALSPTARCASQVAEPLIVHLEADPEEAMDSANEALKSVGLPEYVGERYPHELSGGMKQRVVIAMALIMRPKLVILDEPTSALDVMTQANIINLLKRLQREAQLAYLFITHDLGLASELADDIAIMYAGRLAEIGPAVDVYPKPRHPYTQKLIGSVPLLRSESSPDFIAGTPPDLTNVPMGCRFHPRCPYAFEMCGWASGELADFFGWRTSELRANGVNLPEIDQVVFEEPWQLVVRPKDDTSPEALAEAIRTLVASRKGELLYLKAVNSVDLKGRRVVIRLHEGRMPELIGEGPHKAACWLLQEGSVASS